MSQDIRKVNDMESLITYFSERLNWNIDPDDFYDIDDITYEFEAEDLGLKDEAFAKINSLKQLQPLVDNQKWGIFFVEFDSQRFEVSALRKILSGLIPTRRNSAEHAVWDKRDLLFLCTWGSGNQTTIGVAHFEDAEKGLPQIKMISCEPAVEDFTQINIFEQKLAKLCWPSDPTDTEAWRETWASAFTVRYRQVIQDSHTLTVCLAEEAKDIRDRILNTLKVETRNGYVHLLFDKFQNTLIHDMTEQQFADMYAQTIVYGLFSARCMDNTQEDFSPEEAVACIPNTNPFLKSLMQECFSSDRTGSKLSFDELEIGNIVTLLQNTKTDAIIADFNRQTGGGREDPVIHFYEEFLTEYDKAQKVQRGVYYTPQPVVDFIVRAVDDILKSEFGIADGLASTETKKIKVTRQSKRKNQHGLYDEVEDTAVVPAIQVLDPATGTGTFLRQTILQIYQNFCDARKGLSREQIQKEWNDYVPKHLLPRLNGFELMMAPYAVAHMKLAMVLKDTGYDFHGEERLQVYLTNSLEEPGMSENQMSLYYNDPLAMESVEANGAKKNSGINVVIGNPPYSGESCNKGEWILSLLKDYKVEPGGKEKLQEKNPKWLSDDYVKFIRYAQTYIENCDKGILAYICPHGFLDNPTFRGMRWNLLTVFDKIYILNLHGNAKKHETCPDGSKDENVFDIQQGVCIILAIKKTNTSKLANIYYADLFGSRVRKYEWLNSSSINSPIFKKCDTVCPQYFFIPKDFSTGSEYTGPRFFAIDELLTKSSVGFVSARDKLCIQACEKAVMDVVSDFSSLDKETARTKYALGKDVRDWQVAWAQADINIHRKNGKIDDALVQAVAYRPFDVRYTYYTGTTKGFQCYPRFNILESLIDGHNLALCVNKVIKTGDTYQHIFVSDLPTDSCYVSNRTSEITYVFPLFIKEEFDMKLNLNEDVVSKFEKMLSVTYFNSASNEVSLNPYSIFYYIYAILHSQKYRTKYIEFLKVGFPRVPYPTSKNTFYKLSALGKHLIEIHLMHDSCNEYPDISLSSGNRTIEKISFKDQKVYISKQQYFSPVPSACWEFRIGGYQPLQKWIKDRKGQMLSQDDIDHYAHMVRAIAKTIDVMAEIDKIVQF